MFRYNVFVCILPRKAVLEMTYTVSGGTLNPSHSLTTSLVQEYQLCIPPLKRANGTISAIVD